MNLEFCKCKKEDITNLIPLINSAYRGEKTANTWTNESHLFNGVRVDNEKIVNIFNEPNSIIYLAKLENRIIACIQAKLEANGIHIGLFAVDTNLQSGGVGKRLLEFAENSSSKIYNKADRFVMEVISTRAELIAYYNRRGYISTNKYIDFPKSELVNQSLKEEIKFLILEKKINK